MRPHYAEDTKFQSIARILKFNPSVFELAIQTYSSATACQHLLLGMRPTRLTLQFSRDYDDEVDPTRPIFSSVTHLTLLNTTASTYRPESWSHWTPGLPSMRALTHLCVTDNIAHAIIPAVLAACPRLEALVAFWAAEGILRSVGRSEQSIQAFEQRALAIADERLVLVSAPFYEQWERGARTGRDMWIRVDEFIEAKRRGDIAAIKYILDISMMI
ncbi:hypothetical protein MVEN_00671800 [Mycena venus]|uniref:Uncharacterized protein n=1 Tax=Mycena venus TaxID=2733690 RepID=A0A8H7D8B8_9AGAR|nr:hypothetical protein MVEN_00671800 [Mycena venus]